MSHRAPAPGEAVTARPESSEHQAAMPSQRSAPGRPVEEGTGRSAYTTLARVPWLVALLGLTGVYLLGLGSVLFAPEGSTVAVWWPAAGLSVALLVALPRSWMLALAVGVVVFSGLANYSAGRSPEAAAAFGIANAAEAYVVAWLLTRGRSGRSPLRAMDDLWRLLSAMLLGNLVVGVGIGLTVQLLLDGDGFPAALAVMASHAAAILVFAPLALRVGPSTLAGRGPELVVQTLLLLASTLFVFSPGQELSLTFLPIPLLLWAALRFGLRTVSYQLIMLGILTTVLTAAGGGPFAQGFRTGVSSDAATATLVQSFLIVTALVVLPLALVVDQREMAMRRVSHSEELFRKSFSESFVGMMLLSVTARGELLVQEVNQTAASILGGEPDRFEERTLQSLFTTKTSFADVASAMQAGNLAGWREETWLADLPQRRVGFAISPLSTSAGQMMFSAQIIDISEAYDAAARLRSEKDFTAAVLGTTAALIVVADVEGRLAGFNPAAEKASGYAEEQVLGRTLWETIVPPADAARVRDLLDRTRPGEDTPTLEGDLLTRQGHRRRVIWSSAPLTDEAGRPSHVVLTGIDVTAERNVRSMTKHLLDSASATAFIGMNLRGTITIFNSGARDLLGYTDEEVIGRLRLQSFHDPEELAELAATTGTGAGFETIVVGVDSEPLTRDWTWVRKDGSRVVCAVSLSAVRDAFGSHIGYLAVARDVTEARRSQRLLLETLEKEREAVERLQELDQAKNDFVSMVSHELRTPITSIVGYTEMLQDGAAGAISGDQDRLLNAVRRNGERLIALIEDLLTLSRIEAGTFSLEKTATDLTSVVTRAFEALSPTLMERRLMVAFEAPDGPVTVLGDASQLERVVLNLVGNAIKFTEDGGRVECSLTSAGDAAVIEVRDTGIGIPEEEQANLFHRFFRSSIAQERAIKGTGLGLSIVQSIVHSHGGEITIRSEHTVGTEARVTIPLLAPTGDRGEQR